MKAILLMGVMVSGCVTDAMADYPPGVLTVFSESQEWIQGEPINAWLDFDYHCPPDDFQCPRTPMTVLHVACDGCEILEDPTGNAPAIRPRIRAVATVDGPITLEATVRKEATGEVRQMSATMTGDHEVALDAECTSIDTRTVMNRAPNDGTPLPFRSCETTRLPSESVVLFPVIRTFRGGRRFPFCIHGGACTTWAGRKLRPLASLSIQPAPTGWGTSYTAEFAGEFAILPPLGSTQTVSLNARLATGEVSTTSVAVPPLENAASAW
jgi:hypothetical protein